MRRTRILAAALTLPVLFALAGCEPSHRDRIVVGSKNFTEQLVLGELLSQHIEAKTGLPVERHFYLAGTYICHQAILSDRIDAYVEYTGTALTAVLRQPLEADRGAVYRAVSQGYRDRFNLRVGAPLGFDNTFAMVMRGADARRLGIRTLSDAAPVSSQLRPGVGFEFLDRPDGYKGLVARYGFHFAAAPRVMDLGLLYAALEHGQVDVIAGNATDGLIDALQLTVLEDDRHYFPPYEAVPVLNGNAVRLHPQLLQAVNDLAGKISDRDMRGLNYAVDGQHRDVAAIVREFRVARGL